MKLTDVSEIISHKHFSPRDHLKKWSNLLCRVTENDDRLPPEKPSTIPPDISTEIPPETTPDICPEAAEKAKRKGNFIMQCKGRSSFESSWITKYINVMGLILSLSQVLHLLWKWWCLVNQNLTVCQRVHRECCLIDGIECWLGFSISICGRTQIAWPRL